MKIQTHKIFKSVLKLFMIFVIVILSACATPNNKNEYIAASYNLPYQLKEIEGSYWWRIQFLIPWGEGGEVSWPLDLLLAHAVVSPVLLENAKKITYWRFHRRAVRDATGHMFSFIFYSDPEHAASIFAEIKNSRITNELLKENMVKQVLTGDPKNPKNSNIGDTSDPHWSQEIQDSWPTFIMGVSSLWLGLISEEMKGVSTSNRTISELVGEYKVAHENISNKWRREGQHAFIHHLSAIFAYHPMLIKKDIRF